MSQPEQKQLTVYVEEGTLERIPAPVNGTFEVPMAEEWPGSSVLGGNIWPAQEIRYPASLGGHALYRVVIEDNPRREWYLFKGEGTFKPDENLGDTTTAEG